MKTKGLTSKEARNSEDTTIVYAQEICDLFAVPDTVGLRFEKVKLIVDRIKLTGWKEGG